MKNNVWRPIIEVGFIMFLCYSNLPIGEMEAAYGRPARSKRAPR